MVRLPMSATRSLIDMGIAMQSAALLGENYKVAKRSLANKPIKARDGAKNMIGLGVKNMVGIELLKVQSQLAGGL